MQNTNASESYQAQPMTLDDFVCLACFAAVPAFILALPYILTFFGY